jgi:hypothetical protein
LKGRGLIKKPKAIQTRFIYEARKYLKSLLRGFFFLVLFFYKNGLLPFDPGLLIGRVGQNPSGGTLDASSVKTDRTRRDRAVRGFKGVQPPGSRKRLRGLLDMAPPVYGLLFSSKNSPIFHARQAFSDFSQQVSLSVVQVPARLLRPCGVFPFLLGLSTCFPARGAAPVATGHRNSQGRQPGCLFPLSNNSGPFYCKLFL